MAPRLPRRLGRHLARLVLLAMAAAGAASMVFVPGVAQAAFVAPLIVTAIGLTGVAATIGQAIIGAALAFGVGLAAQALMPKPGVSGQAGMQLSLTLDSDPPRQIIIGRAATAGSLVFWNTYGPSNKTLQLVIALADHECAALEKVWVDGQEVTWDAGTGAIGAPYDGVMSVHFYSGAAGQSAHAALVNNAGGRWTSDDVGTAVCYVVVTLTFNEKKYPGGIPRFLFQVKGAKLYDWRLDSTNGGSGSHRWDDQSTWAWSDNPVLAWHLWRRGYNVAGEKLGGMNTPASAIDYAAATTAANACDEAVALKAGGTEKRYRVGGVFDVSQGHREALQAILLAMAGREIDSGGTLAPHAGVSRATVLAITDDDLMFEAEATYTPKRTRHDLVNAVYGSFHDPDAQFQSVQLPPRISSSDAAADGGRHEVSYDLSLVPSATQGQRVMEIMRRLGRRQLAMAVVARATCVPLEAGDWISWTSTRYGFSAKIFEVVSVSLNTDFTVVLALRETDTGVYAWTAGSDELDPLVPSDLSTGAAPSASLSGLAVTAITVVGREGRSRRPGLRTTWTPPADPTMDAVDIEFRVVGDAATVKTVRAFDPEAGSRAWTDSVEQGLRYEARIRPITLPPRETDWTSWVAAVADTDPIIVDVPLSLPAGSISQDKLDAQSQFELGLTTGVNEILGNDTSGTSLPALRDAVALLREQMAETALLGQASVWQETIERRADTETARAAIITESIARAADYSALAAQITTLETEVDGNTAKVIEYAASIDGIRAQWGVTLDNNGAISGIQLMSGENAFSTFRVLADRMEVAQPGVSGGDPRTVFAIGNVDGVPRIGFAGDMLIDGAIAARHMSVGTLSAIAADLGEVTAGLLRSSDNKFRIDLDGKSITIEV